MTPAPASDDGTDLASGARVPGHDILLVEDDEAVRTVFERALVARGCTVDAVGDGIAALDALAQNRYFCVVLDLRLPKISGGDVLHRIADAIPRPLVVVLSAATDEIRRVAGHECVAMSVDKTFALRHFQSVTNAIADVALAERGR